MVEGGHGEDESDKKEFSRIAPGQLKILRKQENGKDKEDRCPDRVSANSRTPREQSQRR